MGSGPLGFFSRLIFDLGTVDSGYLENLEPLFLLVALSGDLEFDFFWGGFCFLINLFRSEAFPTAFLFCNKILFLGGVKFFVYIAFFIFVPTPSVFLNLFYPGDPFLKPPVIRSLLFEALDSRELAFASKVSLYSPDLKLRCANIMSLLMFPILAVFGMNCLGGETERFISSSMRFDYIYIYL